MTLLCSFDRGSFQRRRWWTVYFVVRLICWRKLFGLVEGVSSKHISLFISHAYIHRYSSTWKYENCPYACDPPLMTMHSKWRSQHNGPRLDPHLSLPIQRVSDRCLSWILVDTSHRFRIDLRETQHTPGAYPRHPQTPKWKEFLHKLLVGGLGYAPRGLLESS